MLGFNGGTIGIANTVFTGTKSDDPNYSDVSLLLNGNGTNGSTTFTDSSSYGHTVTPFGSAQISTTQSKFGGASMAFLGSSSDGATISNNVAFEFGTQDFTIECWAYVTSFGNGFFTLTCKWNGIGSGTRFVIAMGASDIGTDTTNLASINYTVVQSISNALNTWYHIAVVRSGTSLYIFRNGTLYKQATISSSQSLTASGDLIIGNYTDGFTTGSGYIDDLRITKGVAIYTSNFTPPTAQLPGGETGTFASGLWTSSDHIKQIRNELWPGLVPSIVTDGLVLHLDAGDINSYSGSGTTWTDLSGNGNNGTLVDGVGYNSANLGSLSFDGVDDYVSIPNMSTYLTNKTQFSYSTFIKIISSQTFGMFFSFGNSSSFPNDITFYYYPATNSLNFQVNNGLDGDGYVLYGIGQYDNICVVYDGNQSTNATRLKVYINGNLQTLIFNYNVPSSTSGSIFTECGIGGYSTSGYSSGTFFAGNVGTSQLYNRALTSSEVTQNFDALKGRYGL